MRGLARYNVWLQAGASIVVSLVLATAGAWVAGYLYTNSTVTKSANAIGIGKIFYVVVALLVVYPVVACVSSLALFRPRYRWAPLLTQASVVLAIPLVTIIPGAVFGSIVGGQGASPAYYLIPMLGCAVASFAIGTFAVGSMMKRADQRIDMGTFKH